MKVTVVLSRGGLLSAEERFLGNPYLRDAAIRPRVLRPSRTNLSNARERPIISVFYPKTTRRLRTAGCIRTKIYAKLRAANPTCSRRKLHELSFLAHITLPV